MTTPSTSKNLKDSVSLPENEFFEVYECLHTLISDEFLLDRNKLEGSNLVKKCLEKLHLESDEKKIHDFGKGFLPLYYRMYQALKQSKNEKDLYSVQFL